MVDRFAVGIAISLAFVALPFHANGQATVDAWKCQRIAIEFPLGQNGDGASNPIPTPNTELDCEYPTLSYTLHEEGLVVLRVRVLTDGMLANVQLEATSQHPRLDDAALEIVGKKLKVSAAVRQGQPVTVERQVNVTFKITHPAGESASSPASALPTGSVGGAACTSFLLVLAHEIVSHCGEPLDAAAEQRYDETLLALKTFIVENIPGLKDHTDPRTMYSKNEQLTHESVSAMDQSVCEKPSHANMKRLLETVTSVDYLVKLRESMKTWSTDTNAIGCL